MKDDALKAAYELYNKKYEFKPGQSVRMLECLRKISIDFCMGSAYNDVG